MEKGERPAGWPGGVQRERVRCCYEKRKEMADVFCGSGAAHSGDSHYGRGLRLGQRQFGQRECAAPTKPNVVQMSTGIKLNSTVPTYFYADTVKGVIILSPDGMVKTAAGWRMPR